MPKVAKELSAIEVRRLREPGLHAVGGVPGLVLQIKSPASKSWLLRTMVGGKRRHIGLGGFPAIGLAEAREFAKVYLAMIREGKDPILEKRSTKQALLKKQQRWTFEDAARRYLEFKLSEFRNAKHRQQWENTLKEYAYPKIRTTPVEEVERDDVLRILKPIWTTKTETAKRLRGRMEHVFAYAIAEGHRTEANPATWRGNLQHSLPTPAKIKKTSHHKAMPYKEAPAFMRDLAARSGMSARVLELIILLALRSNEARSATPSEIDLDAALWTVPADRMKMGIAHRIPLTGRAVSLLRPLVEAGGDLVFPAPQSGGVLTDASISNLLKKRMKMPYTVHGFRSTFRDWAAECTSHRNDVIEMCLAHKTKGDVEAAYYRSDILDKRRTVMEDWAAYLQKEF